MTNRDKLTTQSCLYNKVSHYRSLTDVEAEYLANLERNTVSWPARRRIRRGGEDTETLYVVRRGWLYSTEELSNNKHHVRGIFLPGDIIGLSEITLRKAICDIRTATTVEVCPVPKSNLRNVFADAPSIAALFFAFSAIETAIFAERLAASTRMDADARLAHFLLQLHSRIQITAPENGFWFRLPLSQEAIGDAIGLSQPYVTRTFSQLEERGLIVRRQNGVELLELDKLQQMTGFTNHYTEIDQSWMPEQQIPN